MKFSTSSSTLPGLCILSLGILILIVAVVLFAAFGIPNDVRKQPKTLAGPLLLVVGFIVCAVGIVYAVHLNKRKQRINEEKRRTKRQNSNIHADIMS